MYNFTYLQYIFVVITNGNSINVPIKKFITKHTDIQILKNLIPIRFRTVKAIMNAFIELHSSLFAQNIYNNIELNTILKTKMNMQYTATKFSW